MLNHKTPYLSIITHSLLIPNNTTTYKINPYTKNAMHEILSTIIVKILYVK